MASTSSAPPKQVVGTKRAADAPASDAPAKAAKKAVAANLPEAPKAARSEYICFKELAAKEHKWPSSESARLAKEAWASVKDLEDEITGPPRLVTDFNLRVAAEETAAKEVAAVSAALKSWAPKWLEGATTVLNAASAVASPAHLLELQAACELIVKQRKLVPSGVAGTSSFDALLSAANKSLKEHEKKAAGKDQAALVTAEGVRVMNALEAATAVADTSHLALTLKAAESWCTLFGKSHPKPAGFTDQQRAAKRCLNDALTAEQDAALVATLTGGGAEALKEHAATFRELKQSCQLLSDEVEALRKYRADREAKEQAAAAAAARQEAASLALADQLPTQVCRALLRQFVYNGPHNTTRVTYTCGGVSEAAFKKAFGTASATSTTYYPTENYGKPLRYGAYLGFCGGVTLKLSGGTLVATASYRMHK